MKLTGISLLGAGRVGRAGCAWVGAEACFCSNAGISPRRIRFNITQFQLRAPAGQKFRRAAGTQTRGWKVWEMPMTAKLMIA